jgi:hypothetical protein
MQDRVMKLWNMEDDIVYTKEITAYLQPFDVHRQMHRLPLDCQSIFCLKDSRSFPVWVPAWVPAWIPVWYSKAYDSGLTKYLLSFPK